MMRKKGLHSKGCFLSYSEDGGTNYKKINDLQSIPELGGDPESLNTTTLDDAVKTSIPGLADYGALPFQFLYDNSSETSCFRVLSRLQASGNEYPFKISYPDGTAFSFKAAVSVKTGAVEVDGVLQFTANLQLASDVTTTHPTGGAVTPPQTKNQEEVI